MRNINLIYSLLSISLLVVLSNTSCKKFVETKSPQAMVNAGNVYTNNQTAIAVLTGMYSRIAAGSPSPKISSGTQSFSLLCGLAADEFTLFTGAPDEMMGYYQNKLMANASTNIGTSYWNVLYDHIYYANSAIEGLQGSQGLSDAVKQQLLGEAKFMRAFFNFYLVNLYEDVPLVTTTDYTINSRLSRSTKVDIYNQIIQDLKDAEDLLSVDYLDGNLQKYSGSAERVRPTKWAAAALLARVYLYNKDWSNAESQATLVINNKVLFDTTSLNNVFLKNSKEAIWQLQPVKANQNTDDSKMFIIPSTGFSSSRPVWISDTLLNSFEANDQRSVPKNWIDSITVSGIKYFFPYKYKNNTATVKEYEMVLRIGEQYLIRAEARAQQNNTGGAQTDLNIIRTRAGLGGTTANSQSSLITAILHERQVELFSEWGQRWFDLKRTNTIDALMSIITPKKGGGSWQSFKKLNPIPFLELQRDPNLVQNPGY